MDVLLMEKLFKDSEHIPEWLAKYFYLANAGSYVHKRLFYKHVKKEILTAFAQPAGYDLQVITTKCWSCSGTGMYKRNNYSLTDKPVSYSMIKCFNCIDGNYSVREVMLERYILNGRLYHIPLESVLNRPITHKIEGIINHKHVDPKKAYRACLILFWWYNKSQFYHYIKELTENSIKSKASWVNDLIQSLIKKDNTADELPF